MNQPITNQLSAYDPDNDILTYSLLITASNGIVNVESNGIFTYQPDTDFLGHDSFRYLVSDTDTASTTGTVHLSIISQAELLPFEETFDSPDLPIYWSSYSTGEGLNRNTDEMNPQTGQPTSPSWMMPWQTILPP